MTAKPNSRRVGARTNPSTASNALGGRQLVTRPATVVGQRWRTPQFFQEWETYLNMRIQPPVTGCSARPPELGKICARSVQPSRTPTITAGYDHHGGPRRPVRKEFRHREAAVAAIRRPATWAEAPRRGSGRGLQTPGRIYLPAIHHSLAFCRELTRVATCARRDCRTNSILQETAERWPQDGSHEVALQTHQTTDAGSE